MGTSKKATTKSLVDLEEIKKAGTVLRSLNHKLRQDILNLVYTSKEIKVTDIYQKLRIEQSQASAFLALLRRAGVVKTRRDGQVIYYSVNESRLGEISKAASIINGNT